MVSLHSGVIVAIVLSLLTVASCQVVSVDFLYCTLTDVALEGMLFRASVAVLAQRSADAKVTLDASKISGWVVDWPARSVTETLNVC